MAEERSLFNQRVIEVIRLVPHGKVVSYGQIAAYVGAPRAARQVGWIMNQSEGNVDLPWWRVVNNAGYLSIRGTAFNDKELQKKLLRAEGVPVNDEFVLPMEKYRFKADEKLLRQLKLSDEYIERLLEKYGI